MPPGNRDWIALGSLEGAPRSSLALEPERGAPALGVHSACVGPSPAGSPLYPAPTGAMRLNLGPQILGKAGSRKSVHGPPFLWGQEGLSAPPRTTSFLPH